MVGGGRVGAGNSGGLTDEAPQRSMHPMEYVLLKPVVGIVGSPICVK